MQMLTVSCIWRNLPSSLAETAASAASLAAEEQLDWMILPNASKSTSVCFNFRPALAPPAWPALIHGRTVTASQTCIGRNCILTQPKTQTSACSHTAVSITTDFLALAKVCKNGGIAKLGLLEPGANTDLMAGNQRKAAARSTAYSFFRS